jgi:hypothetical protein
MKTLEEIAEEFLIRQGCQRMDCDGENCNFFEDVQPKDLIEFAKYQAERMYSEEDLKQFAFECVANFLSNNDNKVEIKLVDVIIDRVNDKFEQFKKK